MHDRRLVLLCIVLTAAPFVRCCAEQSEKDERWKKWAVETQKVSREIALHHGMLASLRFSVSPDRRKAMYVSSPERTPAVSLISLDTGKHLLTFESHSDFTQAVAFSPNMERALSCGNDNCMKRLFKPSECEYNLRLWNLATGEQIAVGKAHEKRIRGVVYSPDGKLAVSGDDTGTILLWDVEKMDVLKPFVGHTSGIRVGCLVWAEDGRTFLSGSWDASVRLWDVDTGRQIAYLIPDPHYGRVMSIALSPDAKYALSSYLGPVIFWDLEKKCEIARFRIPGNSRQTGQQLHIESVAFLPDGKTALFGFVFGTVIWWDLNEWKPIAMNRVHREKLKFVTCSADGKTSISVGADVKMCDGNAKVKFWELSVRSSTPTAQDSENEHR